ncbi:unnamed protein product [Rotaria magnacalcarata]|uniref:Uncharacterized protein n=1 Tax=Rotaria magnacalcarata TaxID=392030 RepID=A0A816L6L7_9BILA|nr:unnamed protein product [Rotaria magnacalcarata]CAF1243661.1 unnamed protein product [Rotaria magnacalcarata]CAF1929727.1 unnamed protein product [Rotaria magnacalcarata]CAF3748828.1 unnamed protein product [Rotaria magnacalcarata]CAF3788267.1 unnamed protein product [Rotaria magnacalcarata]
MPDDSKVKSNENSLVASNRPANEIIGSSEFTDTTGSYPVRLLKHPHRSSGGFILEKLKDFYDYYWHYYRWAPTRVAARFFWSENGWESLKEFTTTGMWSQDVDAPIPQRMVAGLGFGLKASIFIYAVSYRNLRTRYQIPANAAVFRALRPCAFFTASCLIYCGSWPVVRALRGYQKTELGRDIDAALVGALSGVLISAMWIRNTRFVGVSIPVAYVLGGVSAGLYNASHTGYVTNSSVPGGWSDIHHWRRGNPLFGPPYEERLARFKAQLQNAKYKEYVQTSIKTRW